MISEDKKNDIRSKIFCIYFKNEKYSDNNIMERIAKIGGTKNYYASKSLEELYKIFKNINEAIETNFGLKLKRC